ncbi:uncharacterized protein [Dermacentor albipictus]|uniref:uncharacterized protein isoform X7 n=1 Tax=Dermacentor albipictus TaxID=60249 RepID=UPI0038FCE47A
MPRDSTSVEAGMLLVQSQLFSCIGCALLTVAIEFCCTDSDVAGLYPKRPGDIHRAVAVLPVHRLWSHIATSLLSPSAQRL